MSSSSPSQSAVPIPERFADLVKSETKAFASLGLVLRNGTPQVTPMWFDYDGTHFIFNTARGRVKDKIMHRRPAVAFAIVDPKNPYRYLQVRGTVVAETEEGAYDQICALNQKYHGHPNYPKREGEQRVTYRIRPEHFSSMG